MELHARLNRVGPVALIAGLVAIGALLLPATLSGLEAARQYRTYLAPIFFSASALFYFAAWIPLAILLSRWAYLALLLLIVSGLWLALFFCQLKRHVLLSFNHPRLHKALAGHEGVI